MTSGEEYRAKALELLSRAEVESSPVLKAELETWPQPICVSLSRRIAILRSLLSSSCLPKKIANLEGHRVCRIAA